MRATSDNLADEKLESIDNRASAQCWLIYSLSYVGVVQSASHSDRCMGHVVITTVILLSSYWSVHVVDVV